MKTKPLAVQVLLKQGFCCGNECENCPYVNEDGERFQIGSTTVNPIIAEVVEKKKKKGK